MKILRTFSNRETIRIKNLIYKHFPHAKSVQVKVSKLQTGHYKSFIKVCVGDRKSLIAQKVDQDFKKSLERSKLAIFKQVQKVKSRRSKGGAKFPVYQFSA